MFKYERDKLGVDWITLNRPKLHNAFNDELIEKLTACVLKLSRDENSRIIVLQGEGKSFCAGADLNWMKSMKDYSSEENYQDSFRLAELFRTLNEYPGALIAKVHGAVLGGGCGLVAVCDYVLAEEKTSFGFTEVKLGLVPAVISSFVMNKIGQTHARATFLSGLRFDTQRALQMGLIHEACSAKKLDLRLKEIVAEHLSAGPRALKMAKELISNVLCLQEEGIERVIDYTCQTISRARITDEGQEGMSALLEKRKASWIRKS